jgi:hypothetical protein
MPQHKFIYQDGSGMRRTLVYDDEQPDQFAVLAEADMSGLAALNRAQGEHERVKGAITTTLARVPFTVFERSYFENWDEADWNRFLNDRDNLDMRVWNGRL